MSRFGWLDEATSRGDGEPGEVFVPDGEVLLREQLEEFGDGLCAYGNGREEKREQ